VRESATNAIRTAPAPPANTEDMASAQAPPSATWTSAPIVVSISGPPMATAYQVQPTRHRTSRDPSSRNPARPPTIAAAATAAMAGP
jgi:hypothetical protein